MRWPPWSSNPPSGDQADSRRSVSWKDSLDTTNREEYIDPRNLIPTVLLTTSTLILIHVYRNYLRRIPQVGNIQPGFFRKRSLFGRVTSVGDGDNFRLFHTPGGRLAGWGWLPWRRVPGKKEDLRFRTVRATAVSSKRRILHVVLSPEMTAKLTRRLDQIHVRLAGVDAPELAHFGRPAQPFSNDALVWLRNYILHRRVRAYIYKRDQYDRVVATAYVWRGLIRRDVGLQMLKQGLATVYEAKSGAEFGTLEHRYRRAEWWAKKKRKGMWAVKTADFESPRAYKTRMNSANQAK